MIKRRAGAVEGRPLANLGISEPEERVYRWLLENPAATVSKAATDLMLTSSRTQRLLDSIESKGLAMHTPKKPRRYIPSSPDVAIEALIQQRQKRFQDARLVARELETKAASGRDAHKQVVELITSREAGAQVLEQITRSARHEIVNLIRPPLWISRVDLPSEEDRPFQREAQARGVSYRTVIAEAFFGESDVMQSVHDDMKAGEVVRVSSFLPFKAIMADRRIALIPLDLRQTDGPSLLVRSSALLDALYALFELLWADAAPITFSQDGSVSEQHEADLNDDMQWLISLLASGLNDKTIAYNWNVSKRTFERRMSDLMRAMKARTRFQTGWLAALRLSRNDEHVRDQEKDRAKTQNG
jgi:sugar-specific transcriptional regulator TrmB